MSNATPDKDTLTKALAPLGHFRWNGCIWPCKGYVRDSDKTPKIKHFIHSSEVYLHNTNIWDHFWLKIQVFDLPPSGDHI